MARALHALDPALARWARFEARRAVIRRIVHGVTSHAKTRVTEWFTAAAMLQLGWTLYWPPPAFPLSVSWSVMAQWAPEDAWGAVMLLVAGLRVAALTINGTFQRFRWSPHIRCATAVMATGLWTQVVLSMWLAAPDATELGLCRLILALELWNVWRAGLDVGLVEGRRTGDAG